MMIAINTKALTKQYKNKVAVNSLDLTIYVNELFALLGMNGAGKTTTIKMLSCLTPPTSGDAFLLDHSIIKNPQKVKELINISPQETAVAHNLTVQENLEFIARIYNNDKSTAKSKALDIAETFNLTDVLKDKTSTLSGGYLRRLSIALALISNPKILFLDEPTLGLDVLARRELWKVIKRLKKQMTIILTTHYLEEVEALADRVGIMSNGTLKIVGTTEEIIKKAKVETFEDAFVKFAQGLEEA